MQIIRVTALSELGPMLYEVRRTRGLSQHQVAESSLISQGALSRIERGQAVPTVETAFGLATAMGFVLVVDPLNLVYQEGLKMMADAG